MTVSTPYDYTDGSVLKPAEHNRNIYDPTNGVGIMSEVNGGLGTSNLHSSFKVLARSFVEHRKRCLIR